jgi:hypothetical protein
MRVLWSLSVSIVRQITQSVCQVNRLPHPNHELIQGAASVFIGRETRDEDRMQLFFVT